MLLTLPRVFAIAVYLTLINTRLVLVDMILYLLTLRQ